MNLQVLADLLDAAQAGRLSSDACAMLVHFLHDSHLDAVQLFPDTQPLEA